MRAWHAAVFLGVSLVVLRTGTAAASPGLPPAAGDADALTAITAMRDWETHQFTTFNPDTRHKTVAVPAGKRVTLADVRGEGHIANLWMTFPGWFWQHWNTEAPVDQSILKTLILRIYWDGAEKPAVEAPAADFFGIGLAQAANFASRYFGASSGGFFCKFPMPFKQGFRIELENTDAKIDTGVFMNVLYHLNSGVSEGAGYFHAQFHTARNQGPDPVFIGQFEGRGHYVGCTLSMQAEPLNTLVYLEAPEYIYLDDDWDRARIFGTGLEDYFMGGWYFREGTFAGPYHGLPIKDTLTSSVAMYRAHEADAIHFQKRFRMEFVNPFDPERLTPYAYSSVAFCYLDTPGGQGPGIPERDRLLCWYRVKNTDHQSIP